ncbi:type I-E CRISPR-associated protein Cse1/CasA [Kitasatospora sp. NPDC057015]|uniref:type I-E CRISPR-associated protein Cse1/CasA n=1 Tax=Kitasatospora sp. NPDC057015 TaxID=3346001 RepID=UPI00362FD316
MNASTDFSLAREPWIDCLYTDGSVRRTGFQQAILDAHRIVDLALPYPAAYGALYRLLAAMAYRITGLDRRQDAESAEGWHRRRNRHFGTAFDPAATQQYFTERHDRFGLYHPVRPFLQDPRLATDCKDTSGINKLVIGGASGSARPWFAGKHGDRTQRPLPSADAALQLAMWAYYGSGGTVTTRSHGGITTQTGCQAAPARGTVGYHPLGDTLHTTLLAHLTPPDTPEGEDRPDEAMWERDRRPDPTRTAPEPDGPVSLLAGRMRHAILLTPSPDARWAIDCTITWGARNPPKTPGGEKTEFVEAHPDPYLSYRRSPKTQRPGAAVEADGGRHLFRDLDVLLRDPDNRPDTRRNAPTRPLVLAGCDKLPDQVLDTLRLRVVGAQQDRAQNRDSQWWTTTTPPLLAHSAQHDPDTAEFVENAVKEADTAAWRLDLALAAAFNDRPKDKTDTANRKTRTAVHYWPRADTAFWQLYNTGRLTDAQPRMRHAALDAFDHLTTALARSPSSTRRVAQARALLPLPRKESTP